MTPPRQFALVALVLLVPALARAQATTQDPQQEQPDTRPTGLPSRIDWTFNLDAGWGTFGFGNSLFDNPKEDVEENLSDQWFEGYVKPALAGSYALASSSEFYGKLSVVGERTYGSSPELFGTDVSSFGPEEALIGWRSGTSQGSSEHLFDLSVGRAPYRIGHGFLLMDGAAEGGSRGGYWTNARKAFELAAIARVKPGPHLAEFFYLDRDELEESDSGTRLWGANYELSAARRLDGRRHVSETVRASRHATGTRRAQCVQRANLRVAHCRRARLLFEFEYASERNGELLDSNAWTLLGAYQLGSVGWTPKFSYRYAFFQGDDPATSANEAFDPLLPGFYDWGSWWQGEIAGEYFLSNSNLISHQVRAHVEPARTSVAD